MRDDAVPQMAGAEEVVAAVGPHEGTELSGLVLNERGFERLRATPLDRVNVTLAATESFNRRNGNATLAEATARTERILELADRPATVTISCSFGCPFEGRVDPGAVAELAARFDGHEVVLADTIGVASPRHVRELVERTRAAGFHGHNTRNTGYANAVAALEAGARVLDASVGGLGGCPFAPRATGNVATEDLVYLLEEDGVETGIDLDALIGVSEWLEGAARPAARGSALPRRPLALARGGRPGRRRRCSCPSTSAATTSTAPQPIAAAAQTPGRGADRVRARPARRHRGTPARARRSPTSGRIRASKAATSGSAASAAPSAPCSAKWSMPIETSTGAPSRFARHMRSAKATQGTTPARPTTSSALDGVRSTATTPAADEPDDPELHRQQPDEDQQLRLLRGRRRHRQRRERDQELAPGTRRARGHGHRGERNGYEEGRARAPAGLERPRPVRPPAGEHVDDAEAREDGPAQREDGRHDAQQPPPSPVPQHASPQSGATVPSAA